MLKALWQKVSRKATSRALRRPSMLPGESKKSMKEKLRSSQQAKIYETSSLLGGVATLLSNEKSRLSRVLNEHLRISRRLLGLRVIPSTMTSRRNPRMIESDILMGNLLFARRNIVEGITTRLKRWRSSQSSCERDNCSKKCPRCIEDHQQSAESCGKTIERCGHQTSAECRPGSCGDLLSHREYYQSIESGCPVYSRKPARYNDRRAYDSPMCDSTTRDSRERSQSEIDDADVRRVISSKRWTTGKPATEGEIHRQCRPKLCSSPHRSDREEEKCPPSYTLPDCGKEGTEGVERDEPSRPATVCISQQCPKSEPSCTEKIGASIEKEALCAGDKMSRKRPISDPYEDQTKPDPPPPRQQHWTENPPAYCEHCVKKTCKSTVEPSPMMFVPHRGPRKSRAQDAPKLSPSARNRNECGIDSKTKVTRAMPRSQESPPRKCTFPEDKCVHSLTLPAAVSTTKPKPQRFPTFTKSGSCCARKHEREFVISDVSDCKPNVASLKYRLSKCPRIKEMWKIADQESQVDVGKARRKRRVFSSRVSAKRPSVRPETARKGKRIESRNGWTRQRYKVRLRIFQRRNGQLDPSPSPIAELRQPRDEQARSSPSKLWKSTVRGAELSRRLGSPRPSDYCPAERPLVEHKSYPTKMDECRTARDEGSRRCSRKKRR